MSQSWSGIKKRIETDMLCPALRGRVKYMITKYRKTHDESGRVAILVDKQEIIQGDIFRYYRGQREVEQRIKAEQHVPRRVWNGKEILNDKANTEAEAFETLSLTGDRAILLTGSTGLTFEGYEHILTISSAPHDLLFEHAKGIVHHGGVGTMASALRSGKTQLIMPFGVDQPFWASRLYKMGITLQPLKEKELSVENLVSRFKAMNENSVQSPAQVIKSKMSTEHGCKATLDFIKQLIENKSTL